MEIVVQEKTVNLVQGTINTYTQDYLHKLDEQYEKIMTNTVHITRVVQSVIELNTTVRNIMEALKRINVKIDHERVNFDYMKQKFEETIF